MYINSLNSAHNTRCAHALNENDKVVLSNVIFKIFQCRDTCLRILLKVYERNIFRRDRQI